jgi:radical SAM superfamily enzyme YgiQ (UPF0313 family)
MGSLGTAFIPGESFVMSFPELEEMKQHSFEMGPIRPTAEGGRHSLLIRATRNCPWCLCGFCYGIPYNREKFQLRSPAEISEDIDAAKTISESIRSLAKKLAGMEWVARLLDPYTMYGKEAQDLAEDEMRNYQSVVSVFNWLTSGAATVFLQDADTPIMRTGDLLQVLSYLKQTFPSVEQVTSYARSKTLAQKTAEELRQLREAGLSRLYVGLESGDDEVLRRVRKGVTAQEHILAGRKVKEAGFQLSEFCIVGIGGRSLSEQNAKGTAQVLNEINPDYIRIRRYVPREGSPLFEEWKNRSFELLSPHEELRELQALIQDLKVTSRVCFDHYINPSVRTGSEHVWLFSQDHDGYKFPEEKGDVLRLIEKGLNIDQASYVRADQLIEGFV